MANVYKVKSVKSGNYSKTNYTRAGAKEVKEEYAKQGVEVEVVVYRKNCDILDTMAEATGIIEFFRQGVAKPKKVKEEEEEENEEEENEEEEED